MILKTLVQVQAQAQQTMITTLVQLVNLVLAPLALVGWIVQAILLAVCLTVQQTQ